MSDIKIYKISDREIHHFGNWVAVCWSLKTTTKQLIDPDDGQVYTATVKIRCGNPYISFPMIRGSESTGGYWLDEDDTVRGGIDSIEAAQQLADELNDAVEYLRSLL